MVLAAFPSRTHGAAVELEVAHSDPAKVEWAKALSAKYPYDPTGQTGVPAVIRTGILEFIPHVDQQMIDEALERRRSITAKRKRSSTRWL